MMCYRVYASVRYIVPLDEYSCSLRDLAGSVHGVLQSYQRLYTVDH